MNNVLQTSPDKGPPNQTEQVPARFLAFVSRVDRLAELALERLQCAPDEDAVTGAIADIVLVRALAEDLLLR